MQGIATQNVVEKQLLAEGITKRRLEEREFIKASCLESQERRNSSKKWPIYQKPSLKKKALGR